MKPTVLFIVLFAVVITGCKSDTPKADPGLLIDQNLLHNNVNQLTEVIIHDMFSPPVSSRIYAYTSLAAYEVLRHSKPGNPSLAEQYNGFSKMPAPEESKNYNYLLAATKAFFTVAEKITFSADTLGNYQQKIFDDFKTLLDQDSYDRSLAFGAEVGKKILERTAKDNYKQTRGMTKFLGSNEAGKWRPTPPDYLDAAEPHWSKILPLTFDSFSLFKCPPAHPFSTDKNSPFYKNAVEVYTIGKNLTEEQKQIAKYWDDNPFVTQHSGHLMYGNKKITPVGHWIGITTIACKTKNVDAVDAAKTYALTSTAMFDAIITCWNEKYKSQQVRPITVIHELMDRNWQPFLQTPPFPEHTSGHSGISTSAATILTSLFGDNFAFEDDSDFKYIGMKRNFKSFNDAAVEASLSRVYGGIHYRTGVDAGAIQGKEIAEHIIDRFVKNKSANAIAGK